MMALIISCFGVLVLTKFLEARVTVVNQINGLKGADKGGIGACKDEKTKNLLFVLDEMYGMSCDDGDSKELVFDICIVSWDDTDCTYVLGNHLNALMKLESLNDKPGTSDSDKEMWEACNFVKNKWNDIKEKANKIETPITTVRWNVMLGQYPNGIYKVKAEEDGATGSLKKLTYVPLNSMTTDEMDAPNKGATDLASSKNCPEDKYLIYGAVLYNCTTGEKPELIGCIKGPLEKYVKEVSGSIQLSYYTVDSMRQLRAIYSLLFKSSTIPMAENVKDLNVHQICSALAVDADLNGLSDQISPDFMPTFYDDEEITAPWSFPKFKGIEPPKTI